MHWLCRKQSIHLFIHNEKSNQPADWRLMFAIQFILPLQANLQGNQIKMRIFHCECGLWGAGGFGRLKMLKSPIWDLTLSPMGMPPAEGPPVFLDQAALSPEPGWRHLASWDLSFSFSYASLTPSSFLYNCHVLVFFNSILILFNFFFFFLSKKYDPCKTFGQSKSSPPPTDNLWLMAKGGSARENEYNDKIEDIAQGIKRAGIIFLPFLNILPSGFSTLL